MITIQMYSHTSMITLNMAIMSMSTQKTNVLEYEYDYFRMYSSESMIIVECNHDYFHEYPNGDLHGIPRCHSFAVSLSNFLNDYCYPLSRCYYYY